MFQQGIRYAVLGAVRVSEGEVIVLVLRTARQPCA
jgi:hypothetical protein